MKTWEKTDKFNFHKKNAKNMAKFAIIYVQAVKKHICQSTKFKRITQKDDLTAILQVCHEAYDKIAG